MSSEGQNFTDRAARDPNVRIEDHTQENCDHAKTRYKSPISAVIVCDTCGAEIEKPGRWTPLTDRPYELRCKWCNGTYNLHYPWPELTCHGPNAPEELSKPDPKLRYVFVSKTRAIMQGAVHIATATSIENAR